MKTLPPPPLTLRDYQQAAIERVRAAFRQRQPSVLLVMPTGAGKTVCFSYIAQQAALKGSRILLLAHRRELLHQISRALTAWQVPHGVISPGPVETRHPVQVASIPTLLRRLFPGKYQFDLIVIDECHHAVADSGISKILAEFPNARILGVTATPCRLDGRGLGREASGFFDTLVDGPSVLELIDQGYLARPVVYAPPENVAPDLRGVKIVGGDYVAGQLAEIMDRSPLTGDAVSHYQRLCDRAPAIAFCVTVAHAEHVAEQFRQAGYAAAALSGETPDAERDRLIRELGDGRLNVLTSCNVVSEGTDIPRVTAALLLRPTASYALAMQQMGRVLRPAPGKKVALILDHAGNVRRHGLPTEPMTWTLTDRPKRARQVEWIAASKPCPDCQAEVAPRQMTCPECGHEWEVAPVAPPVVEAELEEIDAVAVAREKRREVAAARSLEDLKRIALARGYKAGWAYHVWKERQQEAQQRVAAYV